MSEYVDIISLGAGVQSSTLLMMADRGEIEIDGQVIIPKYAIMSDTGNEPKEVYKWLKFLQNQVRNIEIIVTENGRIMEKTLDGIQNNKRFASLPFFSKSSDGKTGMLWRQCTSEYKIMAVRKEIRKTLGYGARQKVKENVRLWMGISTDEIQRMKPSNVQYIKNVFPLIEYDMSRQDCLNWFAENEIDLPPRSSCIICPYHNNQQWLDMKKNDVDSWKIAVEFDKQIRHMGQSKGYEVYLHRQGIPLDEVNLNDVADEVDNFNNECEGMCGV